MSAYRIKLAHSTKKKCYVVICLIICIFTHCKHVEYQHFLKLHKIIKGF